jgi:hypothetical protein
MKAVEQFYWLELNLDGSMNADIPPQGPFFSKDDAMKWLVEDTKSGVVGSETEVNENCEEWSSDLILVKSVGQYRPIPKFNVEVEVKKV